MDIERHLIMDSAKQPSRSSAAWSRRATGSTSAGSPGIRWVTSPPRPGRLSSRIDDLLARAGTDKSKLLTAQVWLSDMRLFRTHNLAWNDWVDPEHPPVRACVQAELFAPGLLVEIMVTAAR